jgi:DNA integrity scanning protein DisA with diadenylate cyclase activity
MYPLGCLIAYELTQFKYLRGAEMIRAGVEDLQAVEGISAAMAEAI